MQGAAQVENFVQKAKNCTVVSAHMNIKRKNLVCAINDGRRAILQVTKCMSVPRQMLFAKGLSEFVSSFITVLSYIFDKKLLL